MSTRELKLTPGPGYYDISKPLFSNSGIKFRQHLLLESEQKLKPVLDCNIRPRVQSPGPAYYKPDYNKILTSPTKQSIRQKFNYQQKKVIPGPGDYNISIKQIRSQSPEFTMKFRQIYK
eukprot:EST44493.1 Hypothetical protein SS50377_15491 [Spironucleus salmonicida]